MLPERPGWEIEWSKLSRSFRIYNLAIPRHIKQTKSGEKSGAKKQSYRHNSSSIFSGANPNSEDYDCRTPLHSAIVKGSRSYECVRLLLDGGADVNHRDRWAESPLLKQIIWGPEFWIFGPWPPQSIGGLTDVRRISSIMTLTTRAFDCPSWSGYGSNYNSFPVSNLYCIFVLCAWGSSIEKKRDDLATFSKMLNCTVRGMEYLMN